MVARLITLLVAMAVSAALAVPTHAADDVLWVTTSTLLSSSLGPYADLDVIVLPGTPGRVVGVEPWAACPEDGPCSFGARLRVVWRMGINTKGQYVRRITTWIWDDEVRYYRYKPPLP
jgi:hypothetical protein